MLPKIRKATPRKGQLVDVEFEGGESVTLDVKPWIRSGGVWAALKETTVFRKVSVAPDGRYIEWPGEIDVCADAILELCGRPQPVLTQKG
jgi:hypothetical protein